jgi:hypothetical protein
VAREQVLNQRQLNRALLARQGLLGRWRTTVPRAVERMGGVQAQYAPSSYVGLWSRVESFRAGDLDRALTRRTVVQGTLMRATIHLVSAADFWAFADTVRGPRREWFLRVQRTGRSVDELQAAAEAVRTAMASGPLRRAEIEALVEPALRPAVGMFVDLVRVPPSGTWARRRADLYGLAETWVPRPGGVGTDGDPVQRVVRRYLGAFGPAHRRDIATWLGATVRDIKPALDALELRRFRSEDGDELVDLPRAPLPAEDTPAPVRFLPTWDAALLTHCRRAQVLPDRHRERVFSTRNPFSVGTVLVDGEVRAVWRPGTDRIEVDELEPLSRAHRDEVDAEADRLAGFHAAADAESRERRR